MANINWSNAAERAALIDRVGVDEYQRLLAQHRRDSVVACVNGYPIRPVDTVRFGRLYQIDGTRIAYPTLVAAMEQAKKLTPQELDKREPGHGRQAKPHARR